jgi:hypothetical protein
MTTVDDKRAQLLPRLADLVMALTAPEIIEMAALFDALERKHRPTRHPISFIQSRLDDDDAP